VQQPSNKSYEYLLAFHAHATSTVFFGVHRFLVLFSLHLAGLKDGFEVPGSHRPKQLGYSLGKNRGLQYDH
jgi:hypothetical protein